MVSSITNNQITVYSNSACPSCDQRERFHKTDGTNSSESEDNVKISDEARDSHREDGKNVSGEEVPAQEEKEVHQLKKKDREVRAHEMAHVAAGAGVIRGGAHYNYQTGPDGKRYAVGGHVNIDTSAEKRPQETIKKMQLVKKAALAPAQPSNTDRAIAAKAAITEAKAKAQLTKENIEKAQEGLMKSSSKDNKIVLENTYDTPITSGSSITII